MNRIKNILYVFVLLIAFGFAEKPLEDGATFVDAKKKDGKDKNFKDIIKEFEGKVVYVDFWASWCGPCRQEFPSAKKVHQDLKGKEVVFLYISFDRNEEDWKKGISKLGLNGYHLYPTDSQKQEIVDKFQVTGIPRYMLVDKKGKIVNGDAPRPSSGEVKTLVEGLLK